MSCKCSTGGYEILILLFHITEAAVLGGRMKGWQFEGEFGDAWKQFLSPAQKAARAEAAKKRKNKNKSPQRNPPPTESHAPPLGRQRQSGGIRRAGDSKNSKRLNKSY